MKLREGIWVPLNEKPSDTALNGIPREGELVEIEYTTSPTNPTGANRIGSILEDSKVLRAKQSGMMIFYSAEQ